MIEPSLILSSTIDKNQMEAQISYQGKSAICS